MTTSTIIDFSSYFFAVKPSLRSLSAELKITFSNTSKKLRMLPIIWHENLLIAQNRDIYLNSSAYRNGSPKYRISPSVVDTGCPSHDATGCASRRPSAARHPRLWVQGFRADDALHGHCWWICSLKLSCDALSISIPHITGNPPVKQQTHLTHGRNNGARREGGDPVRWRPGHHHPPRAGARLHLALPAACVSYYALLLHLILLLMSLLVRLHCAFCHLIVIEAFLGC